VFDPQTSVTPPSSANYEDSREGISKFIADNTAWSQAHPEQAAKLREARAAAEEDGQVAEPAAEAAIAEAVQKVEGEQPVAQPAAGAVAATPALIDQCTASAPELKAVFEAHPEIRDGMMETARGLEAAKPVLDIVGTPEEAQFAVDHAQRLVILQTNWILSADDPDLVEPAWNQTVDMFVERDDKGAPVMDAAGKPVLGSDFKPFVRRAASTAIQDLNTAAEAQIAAINARLAGVYPNEEAKAADTAALENATYEKAAFDFVMNRLANPADAAGSALPALPANATAEQIAFQKKLEEQQARLNEQQGTQTAASRKAAAVALDKEVQTTYEKGLNTYIDTQIAAMKERGEYLPDFVLNDKWVNPATGKPTNVSAFGARIYLALNAKINGNPLHAAKLASLQALGAAGKDARLAEINRLQALYLPKIFQDEVTRIQDGIRGAAGKAATPSAASQVARVEPQSQGVTQVTTMDSGQIRAWAEAEAAKTPGYDGMDARAREQLIITLAAKKRYGG